MDWLKGRKLTEKQAGLASTPYLGRPGYIGTFASMPGCSGIQVRKRASRLFAIDEAGQTTSACDWLSESKNARSVGDPKQPGAGQRYSVHCRGGAGKTL